MFSKELENLIQATLEDGMLEEYEKAALVKRAQQEGVDLAELEIYINSILQKRQRELDNERKAQYAKAEQKKKEAFGRVCPACGKQIPSMTLKCECGYEFSNKTQTSSVKILADKIEKVVSRASCTSNYDDSIEARKARIAEEEKKDKEIVNLITMFPVPNSKEDIIEFLSYALPNSKKKGGIFGTYQGRFIILSCLALIIFIISFIASSDATEAVQGFLVLSFFILPFASLFLFLAGKGVIRENKIAQAWRDKFDQVILKGRSLRGDTEFTQQLDYYENLMKQK